MLWASIARCAHQDNGNVSGDPQLTADCCEGRCIDKRDCHDGTTENKMKNQPSQTRLGKTYHLRVSSISYVTVLLRARINEENFSNRIDSNRLFFMNRLEVSNDW